MMARNMMILKTHIKTQTCKVLNYNTSYRLFSTQPAAKVQPENESIILQKELESAQPFHEIPGPKKIVLLSWFLVGGKLHKKPLSELHKMLNENYGDVVKIPGIFGKEDLIMTFNPDDFAKVFRSEGIWPDRPGLDSIRYYRKEIRKDVYDGAEGLTTSNGEEWGRFRSIANPILMQPKTIKIYVSRMNNVATDLIEKIRDVRNPSTLEMPENFEEHITNWTLESVCVVALDTKLNLIKDPSKHPDAMKLKAALRVFFDMIFNLDFKPSLWKLFATPNYKRLISALDTMTDITMKYAEEAIKKVNTNTADGGNTIDRSVLERLSQIDKKFAVTMAMDLLVAGVDTTSSAFTSVLMCLAKNPEKQEILRNEILKILPQKNSPLTNENMKNMPYLRACIKEGLRIHPVTTGNVRSVPQDLVLGGYHIPKNVQIFMPATLIYKDNNYFADSKQFIPERWLRNAESIDCPYSGGKGKSSNAFTYLPFGFGPRMCIGKRLVDLELEIGISKIIRNFKVEFNYSDNNLFKTNVINIPNIPLKFKFSDI